AREYVTYVLIIDPKNQAALDCKRENERLLAAQAGTIPSEKELARLPAFRANETRIATLVQDGKFLFEAGKLDEAEAKLTQAYQEDPSNVAAYQYLQMIKQRRMADASRRAGLAANDSILKVEKEWEVAQRGERLEPKPNAWGRSTQSYLSKGRQAILSKLDRIRLDTVKYDGLPLPEVINNLNEQAKLRDPDRVGINFFIDRETAAPVATGPTAIDPTTGLPVAPLPTEAADVGSVTVKINPALTDIRLGDVLDAITKTADKPIKFSILDYAIVFSLRGQETVPLETRKFHVDPNTFRQGLESVTGIQIGNITTSSGSGGGGGGGVSGGGGIRFVTSPTNYTFQLQIMVRQFFAAAGVDFPTNTVQAGPNNLGPNGSSGSGKSIFFNDRAGILLVRATAQDLDIIAAAIEALNTAPPQVNIKTKFIEVTLNDNKALGFNWILGNTVLGHSSVVSGGTQPSAYGGPTTGNPVGYFPGTAYPANPTTGTAGANTLVPPAPSDGNVTSGLRQLLGPQLSRTTPTVATFTGILTNPQFQLAINALQQRDGTDELTAPEVTTESGRQAQIQAVDLITIVTGTSAGSSGSAGFSGTQSGVNSPIVSQAASVNPSTQILPFGPSLDVIPYVSADEFSVQMTLVPTITEFIGYDDPGLFVPTVAISGAPPITAQLPLPHLRLREVVTSVTVWDAQTVVIGGLLTDTVTKLQDKVPLLGDLPLVGRLFQSQSSSKTKKNLLIFVTPTIINPDGSRFHSDEEMPFAQNSIPLQKPVTQEP
ncbi:MAG TPA: hypothetical protein VFC07_07125, partial [Verrucomicrobiae bacterium]|nr:hypothetical protein [Verrucomicrobiae bacterium]